MIETYNRVLQSFAEQMGIDPQAFAKTQEVVVDDVAVGLAYEGDEQVGDLLYFTDLGAPQAHRAPDVHRTLLEANNLWAGTGGATLGLQHETGHVVLCGRIDVAGVTGESLAMLLDAFVDNAQVWRRFVQDALPSGAAPAPGHFVRA
ncbi:MAG TPA: CesT family type III secretion system chaperone [Ramlibacter sp.]|jgi:hypothetical protein|uniref:CesT family type III secretion system chaperone n=1 Tax=Ramlibacter sp. TaxID=1917967 RepID=UPI002D62CC93|nr:CesT family type III secretion system chaperone [Ramlibacter sp.]HZY20490.1 CesT family type III secretion system chaperone [Ramlibacter sp.]